MSSNRGHQNLKKVFLADKVLADLTGIEKGPRFEFVKGVWTYIKDNQLQDPKDGRFVVPDQKLACLMGTSGVRMNAYKMMHYIEAHLIKTPGSS